MNTRITHDGTMETVYDDESLQRAHTEPTTQTTENTAYSPAILKAFKRAKKAGKKNDLRSRKIVAALRSEREGIAEPVIKTTRQSALNF
jgi:hypothetical protein